MHYFYKLDHPQNNPTNLVCGVTEGVEIDEKPGKIEDRLYLFDPNVAISQVKDYRVVPVLGEGNSFTYFTHMGRGVYTEKRGFEQLIGALSSEHDVPIEEFQSIKSRIPSGKTVKVRTYDLQDKEIISLSEQLAKIEEHLRPFNVKFTLLRDDKSKPVNLEFERGKVIAFVWATDDEGCFHKSALLYSWPIEGTQRNQTITDRLKKLSVKDQFDALLPAVRRGHQG